MMQHVHAVHPVWLDLGLDRGSGVGREHHLKLPLLKSFFISFLSEKKKHRSAVKPRPLWSETRYITNTEENSGHF